MTRGGRREPLISPKRRTYRPAARWLRLADQTGRWGGAGPEHDGPQRSAEVAHPARAGRLGPIPAPGQSPGGGVQEIDTTTVAAEHDAVETLGVQPFPEFLVDPALDVVLADEDVIDCGPVHDHHRIADRAQAGQAPAPGDGGHGAAASAGGIGG